MITYDLSEDTSNLMLDAVKIASGLPKEEQSG